MCGDGNGGGGGNNVRVKVFIIQIQHSKNNYSKSNGATVPFLDLRHRFTCILGRYKQLYNTQRTEFVCLFSSIYTVAFHKYSSVPLTLDV